MNIKSLFPGNTRNRFSLMLVTLLAVTGAGCMYYFFFLTSREQNLDAHYYRTVQRVRENIETSMNGLYSMADGNADAAFRRIASLMAPTDKLSERHNDSMLHISKRLDSLNKVQALYKPKTGKPQERFLRNEEHIRKTRTDLERMKKLVVADALRARERELDSVKAIHSVQFDVTAPWNKGRSGLRLTAIKNPDPKDSLYGLAEKSRNKEYKQLSRLESVFSFVKISAKQTPLQVEFRSSLDTVLMPALEESEFDGFIITFRDENVFETIPTGLDSIQFDSLFSTTISSGGQQTRTMRCAGSEYRCYVQPFRLNRESGWKVIGLKSADHFAQQKRLLPRSLRFTVFIIILLAILALPFIKALVMSRTERLQLPDVIFALFSLVVTISLVTLLLFDGFLAFGIDSGESRERQEALADKINTNLFNEIKDIHKELGNYEDSINKYADLEDTLKVYNPVFYKEYSYLFTVDSAGYSGNDPRDLNYVFNVKKRLYFQNILNNRCSYFGKDSSTCFVLEPIKSWREGRLRAAVSRPFRRKGKSTPYVASVLTCDLKSLTRPVIPGNSGFCLIDKMGNVLFHSQPQKSLNENFIDECNNNPTLYAAIHARRRAHFNSDYSAGTIHAFISPVGATSYFIITFESAAQNDSLHGQVFGSAMILQTLVIFMYLLLAFTIYFMSRHESRLQVPRFSFAYFLPGYHKKEFYLRAFIFCLFQVLLLFFTEILFREPMLTIFVFLSSPAFTIYFNYLLSGKTIPKAKTWPGIPRILIFTSLVCLELSAFNLLGITEFCLFAAYQALTLLTYVYAKHIKLMFLAKTRNNKVAYRMLVFVLACLVSVVPAISFSIMAYDTENEFVAKASQLDMMNAYTRRMDPHNGLIYKTPRPDTADPGNYAGIFYGSVIGKQASPGTEWQSPKPYLTISTLLRSSVQQSGILSRLLGAGSSDSTWKWGRSDGGNLEFMVGSPYLLRHNQDRAFVMKSSVPFFRFVDFRNSWQNVLKDFLVLLSLLVILYYVLHLFIRKLFAHEVFKKSFSKIDETFFSEDRAEFRIFVTGLPCSGKTRYFNKLFCNKKSFFTIDMIGCETDPDWTAKRDAALKGDEGTVLIDHFEFDCLNADVNKTKLALLEKLAGQTGKRVIIVSSIHPQAFLELYSKPGASEQQITEGPEETADRWNKAFSSFYNLWFPIQGIDQDDSRKLEKQIEALEFPQEVRDTIKEECSHGHFLRNIGEKICRHYANEDLDGGDPHIIRLTQENIILKVQELAHVYYLSIWSQLTKEEQYVLYDLAQDNLVNTKNMDVAGTLAKKGLVEYDKSLRLMNRSFQNFILTVVEPADLMKMEQSARDTGNWNRYKKPLLLVVVAMLVFIFRTDQSEAFTYITSFAAGVPLVISLLSSFGKGGKAKE